MRRRSTAGTAVGLGAALVLAGSALAAFTGISNGSFENGNYTGPPASWTFLSAGATNVTSWTIESGTIDWIQGYWQPANGIRSIDLTGTSAGTISQTFATTIGNTYVVRFAMSGNPDGGPPVKTMTVSATGGPITNYSYDNTGNLRSNMRWSDRSYTFMATSNNSKLTFRSTVVFTPNFYGPALDNVRVTEIVPTKNDCKKGGWQSMLDQAGHKFKNQGDCVSYFATGGKNPGAGAP